MKKLLFGSLILFFYNVKAQDNNTVVINAARQNESELVKKMYRYPQFLEGRAYYKNGGITDSRFNYNYLTNLILFISPKGDTLELAQGESFDKITIGTDTFCYANKIFIQQLTHASTCNLFVKTFLRYNGREKKGAYGGYSSTSASSSISEMYASTGPGVGKLTADENIIYVFDYSYYLSGKFGKFYPATKKGVYDMFSKKQKQLKEFLETNKIDLNKKEDLEKLVEFASTVLK
ncbi:MAG TPA: hypothetical protein VL095_08660 [Flavisolibacter sp.]|nr:hypothetical protein [Flavisolibacter sp.]